MKKCNQGELTLRYSVTLLILSLLFLSSAVGCTIHSIFNHSSRLFLAILAMCLLLIGLLLLIKYLRFEIRVSPDSFSVRSSFSSRRFFEKRAVEGIKEGRHSIKLYIDDNFGTILHLSCFLSGRREFIAELDTYYSKEVKDGYAIPEVEDVLFHGYVRKPVEFVAVFSLVNLLLVALLCFSVFIGIKKVPEAKSKWVVLTGYSATWDGDRLNFKLPSMEQSIFANHMKTSLTEDRYKQLCETIDSEVPLEVLVEAELWDNADEHPQKNIKILEMRDLNKVDLISSGEVSSAQKIEFYKVIGIFSALLVVIASFEVLFFYIISHAPKYPRLFAFLVREEYRNI